ncbi:hypothetical protein OK348_13490 [Flavobacterium sp. MXW15]|nr:hypothetical protein [Flavobacterium sp. MXW15]
MLEHAELPQRRPPAQLRMPVAPDQHVLLGEQRTAMQPRQRIVAGMQRQVDPAALGLHRDPRRHHLQHRQPRARRLLPQRRHRRQQDGRRPIIGGGDPPTLRGFGRHETGHRRHHLPQSFQRRAQRLAQLLGPRRRPHATRTRQQQRVAERFAQLGEVHADRRLRQMQPLGRASDVVLGQQRVERDRQVEVQPPQIGHGCTRNSGYSFPP